MGPTKNILIQMGQYKFCRRFPRQARKLIRRLIVRQLPEGYPVDRHFKPRYEPWDQRLCFVEVAISSARFARARHR